MRQEHSQNSVTWFQINNIIPIVISLITAALAFGNLSARIDVVNEKVDTIIAQQEKMMTTLASDMKRDYELALKVQALETMHNK